MSGQETYSVLEMKYRLSDNLQWQLFMQAALVNLFQQWIKWIWKPSISITQSSVQHVCLYIMCVRNKFSQLCVISVGVWIFLCINCVHIHKNLTQCMLFMCDICTLCRVQSCSGVTCLYLSTFAGYILWDSCAWLEVYICLAVSSCTRWCRSIKGWNEDRKSNQCSRCLRAYRFPFHFPYSGKTKKDNTWVNEQSAEVIWSNASVDFWH